MTFDEAYTKLLQYAQAHDYTPEQIESTTKTQVANVLDIDINASFWTDYNNGFFLNLRANIAQALRIKKITQDLLLLRDAIIAIFPNMDYEVNKRHKIITLYLDGLS